MSAPARQVDVLGEPFTYETIRLPDDFEGQVTATLVHAPARSGAARGAVLHLHGYNDYFFQDTAALWWTERGYDFYALDLRKYGRSLQPHQTPYFVTDLAQYAPELDEAYRRITERDLHSSLIVQGHSTGGLLASLWVAHRETQFPALRGLVLNAPWFYFEGPAILRTRVGELGARVLRRLLPHRGFGRRDTELSLYGTSLHADHRGEFAFNTDWKTLTPRPIWSGWVAAVLLGQAEVRRGLDLQLPVLCLSSDRSSKPQTSDDPDLDTTDTVIDVPKNNAAARKLGANVEVVNVPGARHDVFCSAPTPRNAAFSALEGWLERQVQARLEP